jgi:hypothetical protein
LSRVVRTTPSGSFGAGGRLSHPVDSSQSLEEAELEFGVRQDESPGRGVFAGAGVQRQGQIAKLLGPALREGPGHGLEGDVFVVPVLGLGRRREDRFGKAIGLPEAGREPDSADVAGLAVLGPSGAREVSARDALEGHDFALAHDHRTAGEQRRIRPEVLGKAVDVGFQQVVLDVGEPAEPEVGELGQDLPLVGNARREDDVEGRDPVAGDEQDGVAQIIELADLAAPGEARRGQVRFGDGAHGVVNLAQSAASAPTSANVRVSCA